ncbi:respiratory nitrate reductase subunit gamma [Deltaproteobacteria bacterium PRO3]|nr:respiratory nitrate reductase subunit gamma [Deltaproteobacteria bacterium PRO3]
MKNYLLFVVFPYVAIALEVVVSVWRYIFRRHEFTSLSSEFLESKKLFWGSVPWHYGILAVLLGHLIGLLFPREVLLWNSVPIRLLILEVTGLTFGLLALVGIVLLIVRRISDPRIRQVTSKVDVLVLAVLLVQVASGVAVAIGYRWGSSWYASALVPYLRGLFTLNPNVEFVAGMPTLVKVHVFTAFLIVAILPFTRLIHFLVVPVSYLWRSYQIVVWNYDRKKIRRAG